MKLDGADSFLLIVAAISSFIAAVVGVLGFRSRHGNPTIIAKIREYNEQSIPLVHLGQGVVQREIVFHQPGEPSAWLVTRVKVHRSRRKFLAKAGDQVHTKFGDFVGFHVRGGWRNEIVFVPPTSEGAFLLHPDVPESPTLSFNAVLRSRPRVRRSVMVFTM